MFKVYSGFRKNILHFANEQMQQFTEGIGQSKANYSSKFLKVSRFQKQIVLSSFKPKTERNIFFLISALASKTGQIKK